MLIDPKLQQLIDGVGWPDAAGCAWEVINEQEDDNHEKHHIASEIFTKVPCDQRQPEFVEMYTRRLIDAIDAEHQDRFENYLHSLLPYNPIFHNHRG